MSGGAISAILAELGWDETLAIPVANAENKELIALVELKQKQNKSNHESIFTLDEKLSAITNHMKNVKQELTHSEALTNAKQREVETEDHIRKVGEREHGRLGQEMDRIKRETQEMAQKKNVYEKNIFHKSSKLDELKAQMNWDQQALEAWLEESEKHSEDAIVLEKYARQDESKLRELNLQLQRLTEESNVKRRKLDMEIIDLQTAQVELDKTAEEFRSAHRERQELIQQWENTIHQLQRRDQEIDQLAQQLGRVKQDVREKETLIKSKQEFLKKQQDDNEDMERKISVADRQAAKMREDYQSAEEERKQFVDELSALKRTADRTASDLEKVRCQLTFLKRDKVAKSKKLEDAKKVREELQAKLQRVTDAKLSAEERAALADEEMAKEEVAQRRREMELKHMRESQFRKTQELHDAQTEQRHVEAAIEGSRAALRNLAYKMSKLDTDILKQQEILYNQDFSIQILERRLNRLQGEGGSSDEKAALEAKIKELTKEYEEHVQTATTLNNQLKHLQHDVRRCKRDMEKIATEKEGLNTKIEELELHTETAQRELRKKRNDKETLLVEENIMKLEIKRLRELLYHKSDGCLTLEKKRLQLETAIQERRQEIAIHRDMQRSELRTLEDERMKVSTEVQARLAKIDKLQKRYDILMVRMAPPEGEEERSQAYYVIKAAQDKEELQRTGDELDAKIRKAEKEIRALENTLVLMNSCNETYRKSFLKVKETSDEAQEKANLDDQLRAVTEKLKIKRRLLREQQEDEETMRETLYNFARDEQIYQDQEVGLRTQLANKDKEAAEFAEKLKRADLMIAKAKQTLRAKGKSIEEDEADIKVRDRLELTRGLIEELYFMVTQISPSLSSRVKEVMEQVGVPLPERSTPASLSSLNSAGSSRQGSARVGSEVGGSGPPSRRSSFGSAASGASASSSLKRVTVGADLPVLSGRSSLSGSNKGSVRSSGRATPK